jgi:DNA helicase-2/ATP-dependent DNA helicase PcrA
MGRYSVKERRLADTSTIHSAKGLEWDVVYLIHATDGCLPSDTATGSEQEIYEELRLAYVALTCTRDFLWPQRYYLPSSHQMSCTIAQIVKSLFVDIS